MILTDYRMTKRGMIALYADGAFLMSVHPDVFAASGLSIGLEIDGERLEELSAEAQLKKAKEKALTLLGYREFTSHELQERLRRSVGEQAAGEAVERMEELGLVDDEDYAERFARELSVRKHYGVLRIRQEMRRKGLSQEQIETALSLLEENPQEQLRTLLEKKYPLAAQDEKVRRRAFAGMLRMGYPADEVRRALNDFCDGMLPDD